MHSLIHVRFKVNPCQWKESLVTGHPRSQFIWYIFAGIWVGSMKDDKKRNPNNVMRSNNCLLLSSKISQHSQNLRRTSQRHRSQQCTEYPKKYAHGFCFAVLCCGYTLTDFPISIRLTSLALWQSNDCPSASKATLMNMDKYFMWIHYERLHNHNKAKHNKNVCIFLGIYCTSKAQNFHLRPAVSISTYHQLNN